jgi:hypothetical protein
MRPLTRLVVVVAVLAALVLPAACVGPSPPVVHPGVPALPDSSAPMLPPPERAAFVLRRGADTVVVERFSRTRDLLSGDIDVRGQGSIEYQASLDYPAQTVSRILVGIVPASAPKSAATQRATAVFRADSVIVENVSGDSTRTSRYATQVGAVPYVNPSVAMAEQIVRRARVLGGPQARPAGPVPLPVFVAGTGGQTVVATVTFAGEDSVQLNLAGTALRFAIDRSLRIVGGAVPSQGLTIVRTGELPAKR